MIINKKIKVAIYSSSRLERIGGLEVLITKLIPVYKKRGVDYQLYLPAINKIMKSEIDGDYKCYLLVLLSYSKVWLTLLKKIIGLQYKRLVDKEYDILHFHGAFPLGVLFADVIKRSSSKKILHCHAVDIQVVKEIKYGVRLNPQIDNLIRESLPVYDHIIAANENIKNIVVSMGVDESRVTIIHNGTNTELFTASDNQIGLRRKLGIDNETLIIISAGTNRLVKGYQFALDAIKILKDRGVKCKYIIAGNKLMNGCLNLAEYCSSIGISEAVILDECSKGSDLLKLMMKSDIYLLPSLIEGFPLVKAEAMAAGLPVITTDVPGCKDFIDNERNGIIVSNRDPEEYANAIERLIKDKALRKKISDAAKRDAQKLDWENIFEQIMGVYKKVISRD